MKVGGRRQLTVPFAQAFGSARLDRASASPRTPTSCSSSTSSPPTDADGAARNETLGLPGSTDVSAVVDLIAAY